MLGTFGSGKRLGGLGLVRVGKIENRDFWQEPELALDILRPCCWRNATCPAAFSLAANLTMMRVGWNGSLSGKALFG